MSGLSILASLARLSIRHPIHQNIRSITTFKPQQFWATPCLFAEPLKKKRRIDPSIVKARDERRKRKMEKQIRRLQKHARQLKPIDELEVPVVLIDEKEIRTRPPASLSSEVKEYRALLEKEWTRGLRQERIATIKNIDRIMSSQSRALEALREESEELYQEAIMPDLTLMVYNGRGPVATPAIKDYDSPDGEYVDMTKKW